MHNLRRGLCHAYVAGEPTNFDDAVVQAFALPEEPDGFGDDPEILWDLLRSSQGWRCFHVSSTCAPRLGAVIREATGGRVYYYGDIYHTLIRSAVRFQNEAVRRLTPDDLPLIEAAPSEVSGAGFENSAAMLTDGFAAGAIVSGKLVAIAHTSALTERHADIGVYTLESWRRRRFATAAASIVACHVQETGRIPVWSTGEDNFASMRVAEKVGFVEVSRRTYVTPTKKAPGSCGLQPS